MTGTCFTDLHANGELILNLFRVPERVRGADSSRIFVVRGLGRRYFSTQLTNCGGFNLADSLC